MPVICVVKDLKSGIYMKPFCIASIHDADREFRQAIYGKHGPSMLADYPEDYVLVKVGEWEEINGEIFPCDQVIVTKGVNVLYEKKKKEAELKLNESEVKNDVDKQK